MTGIATDGIDRLDDGNIEVRFEGIRRIVRAPAMVPLATLGFGFLENAMLNGRSRYPCASEALRAEILDCLEPSARSATGFRDPAAGRQDALTETLAQAVNAVGASGIALLHSMRRMTTQTYNYDEFLGDRHSAYAHTNLGERLAQRGLEYCYVPLPGSGPPMRLRTRMRDETFRWKDFVREYHDYLSEDASTLGEVIARILAAASRDYLPVLLCCEPYVACFDALDSEEQKAYGCHRFLLCDRVGQALSSVRVAVQVHHLNPGRVRRRI